MQTEPTPPPDDDEEETQPTEPVEDDVVASLRQSLEEASGEPRNALTGALLRFLHGV